MLFDVGVSQGLYRVYMDFYGTSPPCSMVYPSLTPEAFCVRTKPVKACRSEQSALELS